LKAPEKDTGFDPENATPRPRQEHLKVTLLHINSALHGVMSCLPEMRPSNEDGSSKEVESMFFIVESAGTSVGSSEMREKAAEFVHIACR
jgi:proteasome activator subunit 4